MVSGHALGRRAGAGAGVRGGSAYGESDSLGAYVKDKPVSTADICATVYACLGIDPEMPVRDYAGRPVAVAHFPTLPAAHFATPRA